MGLPSGGGTAEAPSFAPPGLGTRDFGDTTRGGLDGTVLKVTNLSSDGEGSLRAALEFDGPRLIVFEVAGVIDLAMEGLQIRSPFVTVAGETAPSPGITIIKGGIGISAHDVVIRHLKVRPGDAGQAKRSGWEPDGISTSGGDAHDIVIEHCSVTWAVDENVSASGARMEGPDATSHRITIRNCIIAEGLHDASHSKGPHSKGSLVHDFCRDIAVVGNLYAHNVDRNPYFKAFTTGVIANNVIYNAQDRGVKLDYSEDQWTAAGFSPENGIVSVVGNVMLYGVDTDADAPFVESKGDAYLEDNLALDVAGQPAKMTSGSVKILVDRPIWVQGLSAFPSSETVDRVVASAGARPLDRDAVDQRIVDEFVARQGRVIDSQEDVGGYPIHDIVRRPIEVPATGREAWLATLGDGLVR